MRRRDVLGIAVGAFVPASLSAGGADARRLEPVRPRPAGPVRNHVVVIDPGHGGRDPGAVGVRGTLEKDVVLDIARMVADRLGDRRGMTVTLTRTDDVFLPLQDRREIGSRARASLFVSLHADSAPNPQARGLSAYTLSDVPTDTLAKALADRENAAGGEVAPRNLPPRIAAILNDYVRTETLNRAIRVKSTLIDGAETSGLPILENPKRSANFAVLRAPDVPSLLIETGFLSSPQDEARLRDATQRRRVADFLAGQIAQTLAGPIFI
jgi:N-acetylmuramoyl-L-alanine amidase